MPYDDEGNWTTLSVDEVRLVPVPDGSGTVALLLDDDTGYVIARVVLKPEELDKLLTQGRSLLWDALKLS